ncbi:hypothetical protein [Rhizobium leguminosarum]|uniref:hypothetical protein n=1 Tax=Rhizobium leguminosarum TaxID=384 RepID=UPI0011AE2403|nr:hypothetical protein [Rhizobium leguminosarum]
MIRSDSKRIIFQWLMESSSDSDFSLWLVALVVVRKGGGSEKQHDRATIEALLQDRIRLQEQLAIARACMGKPEDGCPAPNLSSDGSNARQQYPVICRGTCKGRERNRTVDTLGGSETAVPRDNDRE